MDYIKQIYRNSCSVLICLFVTLFVSCNRVREKDIIDKIDKMRDKRIIIPFDKLSCYYSDMLCDTVYHGHEYKYVFFADSNDCTSCVMNSLYDYIEYIENVTKGRKEKIGFYFIFSPKPKDLAKVKNKVLHSNINYPVYIDSAFYFMNNNSHIPSESMFHTFLINTHDSVVLVGNPVKNRKINDLLSSILEEGE